MSTGPTIAAATPARRNAIVLAVAQAFSGAAITILFATGAVVGAALAPDPAWATAPVSCFIVGMALSTVPVGLVTARLGRRGAFLAGTTIGVASSAAAAVAIALGSFGLFLAATFASGVHGALSLTYRFAATDGVPEGFRAKAISYVMVAGVASSILGPQAVQHTYALGVAPYTMSYVAQGALVLMAMATLALFRGERQPAPPHGELAQAFALLGRRSYLTAVLCGLAAYTTMNMIMTAAPLAMTLCGHSPGEANLGIQWHVLGMYGPSFLSGWLLRRLGAPRLIVSGFALLALAAAAHLSGLDLWRFWAGLAILGVGWNFAFVGATSLVVESAPPEVGATAQSLNDLIIFGAMAIGSLLSGGLLAWAGWAALNWAILPVLLAATALVLSGASQRPRTQP